MAVSDDVRAKLAAAGGAGAARKLDPEQVKARLNTQPDPSPLEDVQYTGDLEADSVAELDALATGFRDRAAREADRFRLATDSEHWVALCFYSREHKEQFLRALGVLQLGDKYLDGHQVAEHLGIDLT